MLALHIIWFITIIQQATALTRAAIGGDVMTINFLRKVMKDLGSTIKTVHGYDIVQCGQLCFKTKMCSAFSLRNRDKCLLHTDGCILNQITTEANHSKTYIAIRVPSDCPNKSWTKFQCSCYLYVGQQKSWHNAKKFCEQKSSVLAEITGKEENDRLTRIARSNCRKGPFSFISGIENLNPGRCSMWIGANSLKKHGLWVWAGSQSRVQFSAWGPQEPTGSLQFRCVQLYLVKKYLWDDNLCTDKRPFLCERGTILL